MAQEVRVSDAERCMKCGACMSVCPVYAMDRLEGHVARGRNMLLRQNDLSPRQQQALLSYCLLCRRCESICPARVPSSAINQAARHRLVQRKGLPFSRKIIHRLILRHRTALARILGLSTLLPGMSVTDARPIRHLADLAGVLGGKVSFPKLAASFLSRRIPNPTPAASGVRPRGTVAFFPGCHYEFIFPQVGKDVVDLLAAAGYAVTVPSDLTCCGLAVYNTGDWETARRMAACNIEALAGADMVVTACATCGAALKDYGKWFPPGHPLFQRAGALSASVLDFSEAMQAVPQPAFTAPPGLSVVTYHDPCHLRCHQGIYEAPRNLIAAVQGLTLVEMDMAEKCCGQGGSFGIQHPVQSASLLQQKMRSAAQTGAQAIVTSCPGCTVQLMDGVRRHGLSMEVLHISSLLQNPPAALNCTNQAAINRGEK